jgi:hypothetical protein
VTKALEAACIKSIHEPISEFRRRNPALFEPAENAISISSDDVVSAIEERVREEA